MSGPRTNKLLNKLLNKLVNKLVCALLVVLVIVSCSAAGWGASSRLAGKSIVLVQEEGRIDLHIAHGGQTVKVGTVDYFPVIVYRSAQGGNVTARVSEWSQKCSGDKWELTAQYQGDAESVLKVITTYTLETDDTVLVEQTLSSTTPQKLVRFQGVTVRAGDGSFGAEKDEALFPGLEYLLGNEESSSTLDITSADHVRFAPHPNKVTIPLMSVVNEGRMIALTWDPLQKWDGKHTRPRPLFSSPNQVENKDHHLMGLFLPSIDYGRESELDAREPYLLKKNQKLKLTARITAREAQHCVDAIDDYIECCGFPPPISPPRSWVAELKLCLDPFGKNLWHNGETGLGWQTSLRHPPRKDPAVCAYLQEGANLLPDRDFGSRMHEISDLVASSIGGAANSLKFAYRYGKIRQGFAERQAWIDGIIAQQKPDYSWRFYAGKDELVAGFPRWKLGVLGETASGIVGTNAHHLLRHARITGDPKSLDSGLKALDYMERFSRPQAAQVWEVPVHAPDVLASAKCTLAYVEAYRITADEYYLQKARYWARTGLPFIYFWKAPERDVMKFASVPVFGASIYVVSWFGRPVQWNGLAYAQALYELSKYDFSFDWSAVANGLMTCGAQQQFDEPGDLYGMYPDAISMTSGGESGPYISPSPYLMENVLTFLGAEPDIDTAVISGVSGRVFVSAPASVQAFLNIDTNTLDVHLDYALENKPLAFTVVGLGEPTSVVWNGQELTQGTADAPGSWTYADDILVVTSSDGGGGSGSIRYDALEMTRPYAAAKPVLQLGIDAADAVALAENKVTVAVHNPRIGDANGLILKITAPSGWKLAGGSQEKPEEQIIEIDKLVGNRTMAFKITAVPPASHAGSYQWITAEAAYTYADQNERAEDAVGIWIGSPVEIAVDVKEAVGDPGRTVLDAQVRVTSKTDGEFAGSIKSNLPDGWSVEFNDSADVALPSGSEQTVNAHLTAAAGTRYGRHEIGLYAQTENGALPETAFDIELPIPCPKSTSQIKTDGGLSEWQDAAWAPIDVEPTHKNESMPVPGSAADMSAVMSAAWDDDYLYLAFDVQDDQHHAKPGDKIWSGDSVQMGLDGMCERSVDGWDSNDHEYGFALTAAGPANWCWMAPENEAKGKRDSIDAAITRSGGSTRYEIAIPWNDVGRANPSAGDVLGVSFLVNDLDKDGKRKALELGGGLALRKEPSKFITMMLGR